MIKFFCLLFLLSCATTPKDISRRIPVTNKAEARMVIENHQRFLQLLFKQSKDPYYGKEKWTQKCLEENVIGEIKESPKGLELISLLYLDGSGKPGFCVGSRTVVIMRYVEGAQEVVETKKQVSIRPDAPVVLPTALAALKNLTLIHGCTLFTVTGEELQNFPGSMCLFLNDGSYLSADHQSLKRIDKNKKVLWDIPGHFHHQMTLSPDGERLLILSSATKMVKGEKLRMDKFLVLNLEGQVLFTQTADEVLTQEKTVFLNWTLPDSLQQEVGVKKELSHFNSIYEMPKTGNVLVNGLKQAAYILSPDLKKVIQKIVLPMSFLHRVHDVQVSRQGNLLFFNNETLGIIQNNSHSAIQETDLSGSKVVFEFTAHPKSMFYSRQSGSVQEINDDILLIADQWNGAFFYSKANKDVLLTVRTVHFLKERDMAIQQVKARDLTEFLKHNNR